MEACRLAWLISLYALLFFVFLTIAMAENKHFLPFNVNDERINCTIAMTILYAAVFLITSLVLNQRAALKDPDQLRLVSEEERLSKQEIFD